MPADTPAFSPLKLAFTFSEAREATTFSRQWWYKMEGQGHVRLIRIGGKTLVPLAAIETVLSGALDLKDGHRAAHWRGNRPQPRSQLRRRGRPPKPRPEDAAASAR
jgi:hypothetical protein